MTFDSLEKLIRAADGGDLPQPPVDLAQRVRARAAREQRRQRVRRMSLAAASIVVAAATIIGWRMVHREIGPKKIGSVEIAQLRAEVDDLGRQADHLQRQLDLVRATQRRDQLRAEYARQLASAPVVDCTLAAIDRAASIAVCEGDFLWEVRRDRDDALAAYERAVKHFPESQWATVANQRIEQLDMN